MVTPNFLFGYQEDLLRSVLSPDSFKPRKNIPVLVSIGDRKSEYLEITIVGAVLKWEEFAESQLYSKRFFLFHLRPTLALSL